MFLYVFVGASKILQHFPRAAALALLQDSLGKLFEGLGKPMSNEELTRIVDEADVDHDARHRKDSKKNTWCRVDTAD